MNTVENTNSYSSQGCFFMEAEHDKNQMDDIFLKMTDFISNHFKIYIRFIMWNLDIKEKRSDCQNFESWMDKERKKHEDYYANMNIYTVMIHFFLLSVVSLL